MKRWAWLFGLGSITTVGLAAPLVLQAAATAHQARTTLAPATASSTVTPEFTGEVPESATFAADDPQPEAWPRRYHVRGEDLAGELVVQRDGQVRVSGRTFGGDEVDGEPFGFDGRRAADGSLRITEPAPAPKKGIRYFLDGLDGHREVTPDTVDTWRAEGEGFAGPLLGREVRVTSAPDTSDVVALVIPGLSTNIWNQYGVPYLDENLGVFAARGIEARRVGINTEVGVAENAAEIAAAVREVVAQGKRVLLFAHSKGGADTVTALADPANQDLLPYVTGFVAIQPVFSGARISDGIESGELIRYVTRIRHEKVSRIAEKLVRETTDAAFDHVLPLLNLEDDHGDRLAWRDLRTTDRQAALAAHPFPIEAIPTVTVRSSFSGRKLLRMTLPDGKKKLRLGKQALRTPLVVFQRFVLDHYGEKNDGMVSLDAQAIPGALADVVYEGLDHFEPGVRGESAITPERLTQDALDRVLPLLKPAP
ncbi:MAG: hypothetical protein R3F62_26590 [Planctomycetota bacterium]